MPGAIKLKPVKRALDMIAHDLPRAECHAAVWAQVPQTGELAGAVPPKDELFTQARNPNRFLLDLLTLEYDVPLIADHGSPSAMVVE